MKSVVIICLDDLYYGSSAGVARMNNYARAMALLGVNTYMIPGVIIRSEQKWQEVEPHIYCLSRENTMRPRGYELFKITRLIQSIKRYIKSINDDIVVLNYPSTNSLLLDVLLLLSLRKYHIYCEVNEVRRFASSANNKAIKNIVYNTILESTYKRYDGLVFISRHIQAYYSNKARRSIIIPILSDCNKAFSISKGINTLDFVFVGTVSFPKENLMELLEGFCLFAKDHSEARFLFYGLLSVSDQKQLEEFVDNHKMKERISYMGKLQHSKVDEILSSAGALILSRRNNKQNHYGFSTKLSEYAVSGAPIIMTGTGVVTDYFKDKENCLMCEGFDRLAFKIKFDELANMSIVEKKKLVENSYMVAKQWFDYKLYSNALVDFFFGFKNQ